ncbi:hypothetical protein GGR64_003378 [Xanthomonas arboricola]|nr:hypothetical protein [Xanthomonas sp. 3307]
MKNDKPPLVVFFALPRRSGRIEAAHSGALAHDRHADDTQV